MPAILTIVQHTPLWVFAVLAVLMWLGLQGFRSRTVPIWRLLVTPAIFILWGASSIATRSLSSPVVVADWLAAAALTAAIAWTTSRLDNVEINRQQQTVRLPGSTFPLIRNLLIFTAKYALGVAVTVIPAWRSELVLWDIAVSGASAGYFLGWLVRFALIYRRASGTTYAEQVQ
jgi:hypothetical protein